MHEKQTFSRSGNETDLYAVAIRFEYFSVVAAARLGYYLNFAF